jgi:hypothetical protein
MKINVVKDKAGKIVATFENASGDGASAAPVLTTGHKVEEMEVADNYRSHLSKLFA